MNSEVAPAPTDPAAAALKFGAAAANHGAGLNPFLAGFPNPFSLPGMGGPLPLPGGYPPSMQAMMRAAAEAGPGNKDLPGFGNLPFPAMMEHLSSTQALINLARSATNVGPKNPFSAAMAAVVANTTTTSSAASGLPSTSASMPVATSTPVKRPRGETTPLDLSGSNPTSPVSFAPAKRPRLDEERSLSTEVKSPALSIDQSVLGWTTPEVVSFVESIEICKEFAEVSIASKNLE